MDSDRLYCLMRAQQLERGRMLRQLEQEHRHHHHHAEDPPGVDPDSMEDDDQPYFWNRSF